MDFEARYDKLNDDQRRAVETIDGPVMVIAGPGTGKTELLGMRAANILKKTDTLPENILCLTFTEAGSIAMQKRLREIIGRDAAKVSIFTFHAFGTEIMNKYREYFYSGASFRPADDLERHRIVTEILDSLDYNDPLRSRMNGKYTAISDIIAAISDLKRAGLTDVEFKLLLDAAGATIDTAGKQLSDVFATRVGKSTRDALAAALERIETIQEETPLPGILSLRDVLATSIRHAIDAADAHEKVTPPLTAWKKEWMTNDVDKTQILKAQKALPKLQRLCYVYGRYLQAMQKDELIDFDDMIMQVVHAIEINDDLRYDLQEKFQYIMVDEFQDTNLAQMRILQNLTNNPVVEDKPNILVVGDDDQAIYGFQGADVGNILYFQQAYPKTEFITLTRNYRSVQPVLDGAREVIIQGDERLENHLPALTKTLTSHSELTPDTLEIVEHATTHHERKWIAQSVRKLLDRDVPAKEIAIIGRKHNDLVSLLSYLGEQQIPISYDRRDDVLDDEAVMQLELVSRTVRALSLADHDEANALLPELLAHPVWGIDPTVVWEISLHAYKNRQHWLETMRAREDTAALFGWLVAAATQVPHLPCERMIDILIGNTTLDGSTYVSPFKVHFFSADSQQADLSAYTAHLENLSTIRLRLREHTAGLLTPRLGDFLDFIDECRDTDTRITSYRHIGSDDTSVQLLSAHGSKGLEFDHVFIVNATDAMWGEKASGRTPSIAFPPHLRLRQNGDNYDERLRLFYVAMTRARQGLHISYATENDSAKEVLMAPFLLGNPIKHHQENADATVAARQEAAEHLWYAPIINIPTVTMQEYLAPDLKTYKISASHINRFIDITNGGPQNFLLSTLLRFPSASSVALSYGNAIHATLQRAHNHVRATGSLQPEEDILHEFEKQMDIRNFTDDERRDYLQRGSDALRTFLRSHHDNFTPQQYAELDFSRQGVRIDDIVLTGKLDVVEFDKDNKTAIVTDYKTGGVLTSWDKGPDYQKIKAHKYRQQLLFYKLLVENSRDWSDYVMQRGVLQFVEPDPAGQIIDLSLEDITPEELERFTALVRAVWQHIMALNFPDTSHYEQNYKGMLAFEHDLLTKSK